VSKWGMVSVFREDTFPLPPLALYVRRFSDLGFGADCQIRERAGARASERAGWESARCSIFFIVSSSSSYLAWLWFICHCLGLMYLCPMSICPARFYSRRSEKEEAKMPFPSHTQTHTSTGRVLSLLFKYSSQRAATIIHRRIIYALNLFAQISR
jgi:hypothetical protein